jgi:large repetitive protein
MDNKMTHSRNDVLHIRGSQALRLRRSVLLLLNVSVLLVMSSPASAQVRLQADAMTQNSATGPVLSSPAISINPFQVQLRGQANNVYRIQASTDLIHWITVAIHQASGDGIVNFTDPQAGNFNQRFYRALMASSLVSPRINAQATAASRQDRVLVKPKGGANLALLHTILGIQVLRTYPAIGNLQVLQLPAGSTVAGVIAAYQESGLVEYAEPDLLIQGLVSPNDPYFSDDSLWGLNNIGQAGGKPDADIDAPEAWDILHDASNIIVAVIDSGIRATHQDLAANLWVNPGESGTDSFGLDKRFNGKDDDGNGYIDDVNGINALLVQGPPIDDHGHGTHVAGILGGVGGNGVGIVGVAWRVQIMALKFLDTLANGSVSDAIECIDYARTKGAKIINASWGWYGENSSALRDAIQSIQNAGIIFVAACGNSAINNDTNPLYPASFDLDNIVAVAATTRADQLAQWSSYGASTVDLGAPGEEILSCGHTNDTNYRFWMGTSMAAPHVAGACALLRAQYPPDGYLQIIHRLLSATDPLPALAGKCVTGGRLNLQRALLATDEIVITLSEAIPQAFESGAEPGVIRFYRTGDPSQPLPEVRWSFSGTAVNGSDFERLPTSSEFPIGSDADLIIKPVDDTEFEGSETVTVTLLDGPGYRVGSPNTATVTIVDNDESSTEPVITLSEADALAFEAGADPGVIRFHRTGDSSQPLPEVRWSFSGTAVNGSDFERLPTSSEFPIGSDANLIIRPVDDTEFEGNETVTVTLAEGPGYRVGSPSTATVTIVDNDVPLPVVTVAASDANASESGETGTFTITRSGSTSSTLAVTYTLSGTATNEADYGRLPGSVTIPAGSSSAAVVVTPVNDAAVEGSETVTLTISPNGAYAIGSPNSATVTIGDNDQPPPLPTVTVAATDANAAEPADVGTFTVTRAGSTASSLTVNYTLSGTAQNGTDYQPLSGSLTIAAGSSSANITVNPIDDSAVESNETVILTIAANSAYTVGSPSSAPITIVDDDQPPLPRPVVSVVASDALASEVGPDNGAFRISRTGSTAAALTVRFVLTGTARNGVDYQTLATSVTIPAGASSAPVTVRPINDLLIELAETVILTLSSDPAYDINVLLNTATIVISDGF